MKLCIRENNPDHLIFHVGTNDVPSDKQAKCIAESIVFLAKEVKACKLALREVSKYGVFSGPYFPVFGLNTHTGKYEPETTSYLDTFHAVLMSEFPVLSLVMIIGTTK